MSGRFLRGLRVGIATCVFGAFLLVFLDPVGAVPAALAEVLTWPQLIPAILRISGLGLLGISGLLTVVLLTLLFGRVYCSVLCPLGIWQDLVARVARRGRRPRYRAGKGYPRFHYGLTAALFAGASFFGATVLGWLDPYSLFGRFAALGLKPLSTAVHNGGVSALNAAGGHFAAAPAPAWALPAFLFMAALMLVVTAMAATRGRLFCNTLCPVGGVLRVLGRYSVFRITLDPARCTSCTRCHRVCKAQCIDARTLQVDHGRCVACFNCLDSCPRSGIRFEPFWKRKRPSTPAAQAGMTAKTREFHQSADYPRRAFVYATGSFLAASAPLMASGGYGRGQGRGQGRGRGRGWGQPADTYPEQRPPLAPPGAGSTQRFNELCTACGLCLSHCPTGVLQPSFRAYGLAGLFQPHMDFKAGACDYECRRCLEVCPTSALQSFSLETKKRIQLGEAAFFKHLCIVHTERTACGACAEHCPTAAIKMVPWRDGLTLPVVEPDLCIGCGACEHACPTEPRAIVVRPHSLHRTAADPTAGPAVTVPESSEDFPF